MKSHSFSFWIVILFLISLPLSSAVPVTDLNLTLVNPPAQALKDLNFNLTYTGDGNVLYWRFDTDGNVIVQDFNNLLATFTDNFTDATLTNRYSNTTNFAVVSEVLEGSGGGGEMTREIIAGRINDYNISNWDVNVNMSFSGTISEGRFYVVADKTTNAAMENAFWIEINDNGNLQVKFEINNGGDQTLINIAATTASDHQYNITRVDGNVAVFQDGVIIVSTLDFDVNFTNHMLYFIDPTGGGTINYDTVQLSYVTNISTVIPQSSPQNIIHDFNSTGLKRIQVTVQNIDGNASTFLDLNITGSLKITVFDENKGFAIDGATIDFNAGTYTTDSLGQINIPLEGITAGEFTIGVDVNSDYPQRQFVFDLNEFSVQDLNLLMLETSRGTSRNYTIFQPDQTTLITNSIVEWRRTITIPNGISQRTKTDTIGQLDFFGQQDADYVMRITDEVAGGIIRDYNGTIVTVKVPLNLTDLSETLTPFDVTVGGLAVLDLTGLTADISFKIFSDTTNFYTVAVDQNADFFGTSFLVKTLGGQATLTLNPLLVPVTGNIESIITTLSNGTQRKTITGIRIESRTDVNATLTLVESKFSDISGTAAFHFELGRTYELSFFDATGRLIFKGELDAKSTDVTLFAFLQEARLDVTPTLVGNIIIQWIPSSGNLKPDADGNVTVTQILNSFNITMGDVNVVVTSINDNNVIYSQIFIVNATDVNLTYEIDVNSITGRQNLLGIRLDIFDVNGILIQQAQSSKYTLFATDIIDGADLIRSGLGVVLSVFVSVLISFIVIAMISNFSIGEDLNFIGIAAFLLTGVFVMLGFIAFNTWAFATLLSIGLMLLGRTK